MINRIMSIVIILILCGLIDYYLFQAVLAVSRNWSPLWKNIIRYGFWLPTLISLCAILWYNLSDPYKINRDVWIWLRTFVFGTYLSKFIGIIFVLLDDLQRGFRWVVSLFYRGTTSEVLPGDAITRSEFLTKAALVATAVPLGAMTYGIISGAHDYRVRKVTVSLPNLPKSFDGIRIGQVSDIHSGSFWNKTAVKGGVEMMMNEKPDLIFFTGDLVNDRAEEVKDYIPIFGKLNAPMGVYSITGNHDYGDYAGLRGKAWEDNLKNLQVAHREMGYDILMNENRFIAQGGDKIAILGIENWGAGRFSKYGKIDAAYRGTEEAAVKLLLSHDPSHWDAQVRPSYPDVDMMFSGHTHGFQFGVEIGNFKWSPSQYVYKQWAGLYREGSQYLYVNRGFGYLGYPGRIGMPPELTIIELKKA
jgi:predicted MPP superfamily phosphohydrolase